MKSFLKKKWVYLSEGCKIWVRKRKGKGTINVSMGKAAGNSVVFLFIGNAKNSWFLGKLEFYSVFIPNLE